MARPGPIETDEFGFLEQIRAHWFPMHHTLFMAAGRLLGMLTGDAYRGLLVLDMVMSALALVSLWWWLRALVPPADGRGGSSRDGRRARLLGIWCDGRQLHRHSCRGRVPARGCLPHLVLSANLASPFAAAVVLALGTGYRQDIGTFWLPVFLVILWKHRWRPAILAAMVFTVLNLAWLLAMLHEAGGWSRYRAQTADFAYHAGYLNSVWNLGLVDAPLRYAVKLSMALLWTLGPCLLFVPRGILRLRRRQNGGFLIAIVLA